MDWTAEGYAAWRMGVRDITALPHGKDAREAARQHANMEKVHQRRSGTHYAPPGVRGSLSKKLPQSVRNPSAARQQVQVFRCVDHTKQGHAGTAVRSIRQDRSIGLAQETCVAPACRRLPPLQTHPTSSLHILVPPAHRCTQSHDSEESGKGQPHTKAPATTVQSVLYLVVEHHD